MRLINGLIFGAGFGLITAGATGLADDHIMSLFTVGALLMATELARAMMKHKHH